MFILVTNDLLTEKNHEQNSSDSDEMKEFIKNFVENKANFGITNNQIAEALNAEFKNSTFTESALSKFERLDITPRSSAKVKPVLEKLLNDSKLKFGDRLNSFFDPNKKRKRDCNFSPNALNTLNKKFDKIQYPNETEILMLANQINYDEEMIKNWFNEKRQLIKPNNSVKKFKKTNIVNTLNLIGNDSSSNESNHLDNSEVSDNENNRSVIKQATPIKKQIDQKNLKKTPPFISSFSISSPSAAVLFGQSTQNSFNIPTDIGINVSLNTSNHNSSATTKLLASKVDLMSGRTELQIIKPINENELVCNAKNSSKSDNSTDLSCIDDAVLAAFVNDFSYELVQK